MKRLVFRFDIDTHKCIRDGVPKLLDIAKEYNLGFSFFLNTGKSISFKESLKEMLLPKSGLGGGKTFIGKRKAGHKRLLSSSVAKSVLDKV